MKDMNCWESKFKLCRYSDRLLKKLYYLNKDLKPLLDILEIKKAIYYARKFHDKQKRETGEPYYSHPIAVAEMVVDFCSDVNTIVAAILHDVIEDTHASIEDVSNIFGHRVAEIVKRLTRFKLPNSNCKISSEQLINKSLLLLINLMSVTQSVCPFSVLIILKDLFLTFENE